MQYCEAHCLRAIATPGQPCYVDVTSQGDAPMPHLHRTCDLCGYMWLTKTLDG
jgi:hypothetical protein